MAKAGIPVGKLHDKSEPGVFDGPSAAYVTAIATGADGEVAEIGEDKLPSWDDQQSLIGSEPEIQIALADFDCRAEVDYLNRFVEVQRELEEKFVASHKKQLDELTAYVEQLVG